MQTLLDDWEVIDQQITKTKIKRIPYISIIGETLTNFVTRKRSEGLISNQVITELLRTPEMIAWIEEHRETKDKIKSNIQISVSARFGEQNALERRLQ